MPQEKLQTSKTDGNDDLAEDSKALIKNIPDSVFDDSGIIALLKEINPKYAGYNTAHLRSLLVKNEELLDEFAVRIISSSSSIEPRLAKAFKNDTELYQEHKQKVKDYLYFNLTNDILKGESIKTALTNRTYKLRTSGEKKSKFKVPGYDALINRESKKRGVDPDFIRAIIMQESGGDPDIVSEDGAIGFMQLLPSTAKDLGVDPNDPEDNLRGGIKYFAQQLNKFQDVPLALAAYNAGPNKKAIKQGKIPEIEETKDFIEKVLGNYQSIKGTKIKYDFPLSAYQEIALKNKDKYEQLGLVDIQGKFKLKGEQGQKTFINKLVNNENLHKELISDRYEIFIDKLNNSNNKGAIDETDINEIGKAWAVYDQFGSEGLTRFLNLRQHFQRGVPTEEQPTSVQDALKYIKNTKQSGYGVQDYIRIFYGNKNHPLGKLEYTPITQSLEIQENVPPDLNNYSKFFDKGIKELTENLIEKEGERGYLDHIIEMITPESFSIFPEARKIPETPIEDATSERILEELKNGLDTNLTRAVKYDIIREATSEDGIFGLNDLFKTIMANHDEYSEKDGHPIYIVDYENADFKTKVAIDALRSDSELGKLIFMNSDGNVVFDPQYMQRLGNRPFSRALKRDYPAKIKMDSEGNPVGIVETLEQEEAVETLGRTIGVVGFETAKFIDNLVIKPLMEKGVLPWIETLQNASKQITGEKSEFIEELENQTRQGYRNVREATFLDSRVTSELPLESAGDFLPVASSWATPMLEYLLVAGKLGNKGLKAPYEYIKQMSKARSALMNESAASILSKSERTVFGALAKKAYIRVKAKAPSVAYAKYALGSANIEFLNSDEWSLIGNGLVDQVVNGAIESIGGKPDLDLKRTYALSDTYVRSALDILSYETIGLLADSFLGLLGMGLFTLRGTKKGIKYNPEIRDFERIKNNMFVSDSRRFIFDMFNGLQDAPIGTISESLSNKFTGRAFVHNPENAQTLADAVTGFADKSSYIFRDIKKIIKDNIEHYDKLFGGKIRLSKEEIDLRVDGIYDDFMDKTAVNIKSILENTSEDELLTLKVANLLDEQAPHVNGTVPYYKDGQAYHVMTTAQAEEVASQSNRYIVRPYQESEKFARVFEVEDGLWTTELANRIRFLYKNESVEEVIERHAKRRGIGKNSLGRTQKELEQIEEIEKGIRAIYGQEVTIENKKGYVVDISEKGFVVRDVDGQLYTDVKIQQLNEVAENITGVQFYDEIETVVKGGNAKLTGNGAVPETIDRTKQIKLVPYSNVSKRAQEFLDEIDRTGEYPNTITEELLQLARRAKIKVFKGDSPVSIVNKLRVKALNPELKKTLDKIKTADKIVKKFKKAAPKTKKVQDTSTFKTSGLGESFMKQLNKFAGYVKEGKGAARKFSKLLGVDNTEGYKIFGKNLSKISEWTPKKASKGIPANNIFKYNRHGLEEYYINTKKVTSEDTPAVWVKDNNGNLRYHDKWRRIGINYTLREDGTLPLFTKVDIDGESWFREALSGERGVFLNIQNPIKDIVPDEVILTGSGIDAIERNIKGKRHFKLINEGQQTINPKLLKEIPSKIYNSRSTVKLPKDLTKGESSQIEADAVSAVAEYIQQAGFGKSIAFALAGSLVDNFLGTVPNPDEEGFKLGLFSLIGGLMGSKRIRTGVKSAFNGFSSKPIKDLFDNGFSSHIETERVVKARKEGLKHDITYDPLSENTTLAENFITTLKNTGTGVKNVWASVKNNEYVTSSFTFLRNIGSETGIKFLRALQGMNKTINDIASLPQRKFKAAMQRLPEVDSSGDVYLRFINEDGPKLVRQAFPDQEFTKVTAQDNFNLAFFRLMNSGAKITEEGLSMTPPPNVVRMYKSSKGAQYRQLDEILMQNPQFQAFIEAHKDFFTGVMKRWKRQINSRLDRIFSALPDETRDPIRTLLDSKQSYGLWKGTLNERDKRIVTELRKSNKNVKRLIDLHNTKMKFTDLDRKYFPQILSRTKSEAAFRQYIAEKGLHGLHPDKQREAWNEHMVKVMYDLNTNPSSKKKLMQYDPDSGQFATKNFSSRAKARSSLSIISEYLLASKDKTRFNIAKRIENNPEDFIEKKVETLIDKNGNVVRDKTGKPVTEESYILIQPEDLELDIFGLNIDNFKGNLNAFKDFYTDLTNNAFIRNSNFLERPRIKHLPHEILETDINTVRRRYSTDVGRRIHNAEHNMFDETELTSEYLNPIIKHAKELGYDDATISDYKDRLTSIYNVMNNTINKSGAALKREVKFRSVVDLFKNALFSRFGYGFGWYNLFEWAVVGPNLSSFSSVFNTMKLFTMNKQALKNAEFFLRDFDMLRKEIGAVNPDFERYGLTTDSDVLNFYSNIATKTANFASDFSFTKSIGKVLGWDVNNWGVARLGFDSFLGSNMVSSTINAMAALGEARYLARIARELEQITDGPKVLVKDNKRFTIGEVKRKLAQLGVTEDIYDRFLSNINKTDELWDTINSRKELDYTEIAKNELPDHIQDTFTIMQTATENFHGTNKLYRPAGWNSPVGKALSTYSTYPFNFALQAVQRRIRQPISDWWINHGTRVGLDKSQVTGMKILYNLSQGNLQALRNMGLDNTAIENIPVDAYRSVLKLIGTTMGVSVASYTTIDAVNDIIVYPINNITGQEQWRRLRRRTILNPGAPKEDQITWADVDEEFGIDTFMNITHYMLGLAARSSTFGRYGDIITQQSRLSRSGILSFSPMTSMVDQTFRDVFKITSGPVTEYPKEMSNAAMKFFINNMPVLGANVFGELRRGVYEQVRLREPTLRLMDESTDTEITIESIDTTLE